MSAYGPIIPIGHCVVCGKPIGRPQVWRGTHESDWEPTYHDVSDHPAYRQVEWVACAGNAIPPCAERPMRYRP